MLWVKSEELVLEEVEPAGRACSGRDVSLEASRRPAQAGKWLTLRVVSSCHRWRLESITVDALGSGRAKNP